MLHALLAASSVRPIAGSVTLDVDFTSGDLSGRFETELPSGGDLALASYLAALNDPYMGTDVDRLWDYPAHPESSRFVWLGVLVDGANLAVTKATGLMPLPRGKHLVATFRAHIPQRYGPLGEVHGNFLLMAVSPFLVANPGHPQRARALPVIWQVQLKSHGEPTLLSRPAWYSGDPSEFFIAAARHGYRELSPKPEVAIVMPKPLSYTFGRGANWPVGSIAEETLDAPAREELGETYEWIASALARFRVPPQRWLVAALRREPAICAGDTLLVSRELYRLAPLEPLLKFHRFGLARLALACAFEQAWHLLPEDADALGAFFARQLYLEMMQLKSTADANVRDTLKPLSFIPDVDSLLYAPKMPWAQVYFSAIDETQIGPPEPRGFFHNRPPGKILYEKLRDRLGRAETDRLFSDALWHHEGLAAETAIRDKNAYQTIVDDFLQPYPAYDASFTVSGRIVHVLRAGPGASAREPIEVRVVDADGHTFTGRFSGNTIDGDVEFAQAKPPLKAVTLDPDRRVVETFMASPDKDPRYNDSTSHRYRLTLGQLSGAYGTAGTEVTLGVDFILRKEFDLANYFGFGAYYDPTGIGTSARYAYAFGQRIDGDTLAYRNSFALSFSRFNQGFAEAPRPVDDFSLAWSLLFDNRVSARTAMRGLAWSLHVDVGQPVSGESGTPKPYLKFGGGLLWIAPLAYAHALAIRIRLDGSAGEVPLQDQYSVGGRFYARGYAQGDTVTPERAIASFEYRHELVRGFRANFLKGEFVDGIEGALFSDVVATSPDFKLHQWIGSQNLYPDVGYGWRLLLDQAGINPGVFSVDVGVPLKDMGRRGRAPVTVYVGFAQSFSEF